MTYHEAIIIGAGPGGLQMSYFFKKAGRPHIVLEQNSFVGSSFAKYPRHGTLISLNKKNNFFKEKEFNMRHDWNSLVEDDCEGKKYFGDYTDELFPPAKCLLEYLHDYALRNQLPVKFSTHVVSVERDLVDGHFVIATNTSIFRCKVLLVGTGAVGENYQSDVPGIELAQKYEDHNPADLNRYKNKRVLIIGGGNSGFETANHLAGTAAIIHVALKRPVKHAWDTHFVGDLRAINNGLLDMYQLKSLHATIGDPPSKIEKNQSGTFTVTFNEYIGDADIAVGVLPLQREYDEVISCTGFAWMPKFLSPLSVATKENLGRYPQISPTWESVNTKNLFFIGGAMQGRDRKAASGFIHGFRYNIQSLFHILCARYWDQPLRSEKLSIAPAKSSEFCEKLSAFVCDRLTVAASLFQMFSVLCDVMVVPADGSPTYIYDVPKQAILEGDELLLSKILSFSKTGACDVFLICLDFGFSKYPQGYSSNNFLQDTGTVNTRCGAFLHPVVSHCVPQNGKLVRKGEYHLFETLDIRFNTHFKPLESASTLSQQLLTEVLSYTIFKGAPEDAPPLLKFALTETSVEEKRRLFRKVFPVVEEWSSEQREMWKSLHIEAQRKLLSSECTHVPLPVCSEQAKVVAKL
eukprot:TRINITY_DN16442_c0_g1_i1.p1 TRINITY_DN16442_c0_g1~~TRINITY_DN16442_c0_g1_i1.p1  ORF type:complete len:634 (+),score=110.10 TRINITY_DN16442_c0_g1_i1:1326-3227(+)